MSGYTRQSVADIIANAVVKAAPLNAEFNALRDAFSASTGHRHDGTAAEGAYVPLVADPDGNNKVVVDTANNRISIFVEVGGSSVEQLRIQDGVIVPVTDNDIDLGTSVLEFKNLFIDGTAKVDTLTVDENATVAGTLNVTGLSTLATADVNGGTIDGTVIGASSPAAVTGTNVTATVGFSGTLTGNVTGNLTGNSAGTHTGAVIGDVTGNVTASSGSSSFNDITINGSLNMNSGTVGTITGLSAPSNGSDAATKTYVDTADNLKLNLSGGTMSGAIAMGTNKITGLGTPTSTADAATKGYVDTTVANLIDSAPGTLDTLNELAAALGDDPNFAATTAASIATKVSKAGDTLTGDLVMGSNKITSTATPATDDTLTRKGYVDTQVATRLPLAGGTMSGAIAMGTNKITGVGDPTSNQDAATKFYVDTADATKLSLSGGTMTGNIVMGSNKVTSTATPTTDDDLTRKGYVDSILGSATSAATSAAAAAVSETNAAGSASAASTSATNAANSATAAAASYDSFDDRYLGAKASPPSLDNDGNALLTGALYFDSTAELMRVYTGTAWVDAGSSVNGTSERNVYTATSGQTTFAATYDLGFVDVYLNGVKLVAGTDFTATSGTSVVLTTGAALNDTVDIVAYGAFDIANTYTQAQSDARFVNVTGDTITGALTVDGNLTVDTNTLFVDATNNKVGIGTSSPSARLHVTTVGTSDVPLPSGTVLRVEQGPFGPSETILQIAAESQTYGSAAIYMGVGALAGSTRIVSGGSSSGFFIQENSGGPITLSTTGGQSFRVDASGNAVFLKGIIETVFALSGTTPALDPVNGTIQTWTLSGNSSPTDSFVAGESMTLMIDDGSAFTITWPSVTWESGGGTAPTLETTGFTVVTLWKVGTTLYGARVGGA